MRLTPLESLERIKSHNYHEHSKKECLEVIENALKEYAGFQIVFELSNRNEGKKIHDKLKAFEIIKEKFVNITILMGCDNLEEYNKHPLTMRKGRLTQEEFNLLKEVLL